MKWLPKFVDMTGFVPYLTGFSPDLTRLSIPNGVTNFVIRNSQSVQTLLFSLQCKSHYRTKRHSNISFPWIIKSTNMKDNITQPWIYLSSFQKSLQWFNTFKIDHKTNKRDESIMINWLFILMIKESNNI